jgi:small-conductance mechanosensitive channel
MWDFLAGNVALGLAVCLSVAAIGWWQRAALADMARAPEPAWRAVAWGAFALTVALLLWCTFADDWRKMFGELLDIREQYSAQRTVKDPVAGEIRAVTLALLVPALLLAGALFARYLGGYGLQAVLLIIGFSSIIFLYLFRQRLDAGLVTIVLNAPATLSAAALASLFYILIDYAANIALILMAYLALLALFALPITAVLDLLGRRDPPARPTTADSDFYAKIRANVAARNAEAERMRQVRSEER